MAQGVIIAGSGRGCAFARQLSENRLRKVVALVEPRVSIHPELRQRFDIEYQSPETVLIPSLEEALARFPKEVADTVVIVTPNDTHAELLRLSLEAGRHVMLEKPAAASQSGLEKIARVHAEHPDLVVQLGFVLRFSEYFRKVKEIIDSGDLGQLVLIQMNEWLDFQHSGGAYRRGWRRKQAATGGFLNEKCSHDLDLMCMFKDGQSEPVSVYSVAGTQMFSRTGTAEYCSACDDRSCPFRSPGQQPPQLRFQLYYDEKAMDRCVFRSDADIFNIQSVTTRFADGTQGILTLVPYSARPGRSLVIHGTDGYLEMNEGELKVANYRRSGMELHPVSFTGENYDGHGGGDGSILPELFECIRTGSRPSATVYDGLRASAIAFAADESARTNTAINLTERLNKLK